MIVADRKDLNEIMEMIRPYENILVAGCNTCVTFCAAGGPEEVDQLAEAIVSRDKTLTVDTASVPRQCSSRFIERLAGAVEEVDAVVSMACGNGVQAVAGRFPDVPVMPALNTQFIGVRKEPGLWTEMCTACGDCILWRTGGICPVTRCAKGLLNGACGGASNGMCEVSKTRPCAWQEIYYALRRLNQLHYLELDNQVKDWPLQPGRTTRPDLQEGDTA
jgi:hypothetical protein